ncbi:plasmid pRiA4b ORF-3 family protein [Kineosporia babensis]|uniref:Plasmid pRiA4b ORF-3 family protein n=1 Tax=Kineosporia babensis TaxID=499548 RepID=A0A9X1NE03_9ACTN|nr:plasmid pRiA4b ORF-3 family protein [Kineosporia babensis]MCD5311328.1 plasmid pRiA4b ORF-3 family protein [Kineosporia babensis]
MSPRKRRTGPTSADDIQVSRLSVVRDPDETCDCEVCKGENLDPEALLASIVDDVALLADEEDPLSAELAGAAFLSLSSSLGDEALDALLEIVPAIEARGSREALTLLTAIAAMAGATAPPVATAAQAAADRLAATGITAPAWADELTQPLTAGPFSELSDAARTLSILVLPLQRAERQHTLIIMVDHENCGAAGQIMLVDAEDLVSLVAALQMSTQQGGITLRTKKLSAPAFRWHAEQALDSRAVHDQENGGPADPDLLDDEDGPGYATLALLTRARLATLPAARRPKGAPDPAHVTGFSALDVLREFAALTDAAQPPARRRKSDGPAPVYQIKVGLRDAKPPIWRRLLVPADVTLADLHKVIQSSFNWDDSHLHAFETPYGDFGHADPELGHQADSSITLEQVAPSVKDKIVYTYDFGDDWEHQILVEKISPADPMVEYPVCTGGRRAAPPEDCGGIWGYQETIEALADPSHPEHAVQLEWMGLADPDDFDPAAFDLGEINERLRGL